MSKLRQFQHLARHLGGQLLCYSLLSAFNKLHAASHASSSSISKRGKGALYAFLRLAAKGKSESLSSQRQPIDYYVSHRTLPRPFCVRYTSKPPFGSPPQQNLTPSFESRLRLPNDSFTAFFLKSCWTFNTHLSNCARRSACLLISGFVSVHALRKQACEP